LSNKQTTMEEREAVIRKKEQHIEQLELKAQQREKQWELREQKCVQREAECARHEHNIKEKEEELARRDRSWKPNPPVFKPKTLTPIKLILRGGMVLSTTREILLQFKETRFGQMVFENDHQIMSCGELHIDRDPLSFLHVLVTLHGMSMDEILPHTRSAFEYYNIYNEFAYYKVPFPFKENPSAVVLEAWFPNKKLTLLYKATVDGYGAYFFHRKCDYKGPAVVVIHSKKGFIFGGYTPISFGGDDEYRTHADAFLFTITNPHNIPPTRYFPKKILMRVSIVEMVRGQSFQGQLRALILWSQDIQATKSINTVLVISIFPKILKIPQEKQTKHSLGITFSRPEKWKSIL